MTSERYIAAAYLAVFVAVLVYLVIIALKLARLQATVAELAELALERHGAEAPAARETARVG